MNYESAVRYLLSLGRELAAPTQAAAAKFNLENITILLERLGGRIARIRASISRERTERVRRRRFLKRFCERRVFGTGLNTSPHLERINERVSHFRRRDC